MDLAGASTAVHTFLTTGTTGTGGSSAPVSNIKLFKAWGGFAMTGAVTLSNPAPNAATYTIITAMDSRNTAGTSGTIQLVTPRILYGYGIAGPPPAPQDGTGTVTGLQTGVVGANHTTLNFLPEPGQIALLGIGILGLMGISRLRRG